MLETTLTTPKYWKGKIYPAGKQLIPADLAEYLKIPTQTAIAPPPPPVEEKPYFDPAIAINRRLAQIEEQNAILVSFYKEMDQFLVQTQGRLNYVPEVQFYSGGAFPAEIGAVTNSNPKQTWHFATAKTNKPSTFFDNRAKDAIVLRGGTTYSIELNTTIFSFAAANATVSSTFETLHTPAPEVFSLIGSTSRFKDDHQYPNNGLLIVKTPGKKEDFITYNIRVFRAAGSRIQGDAFAIVREIPDDRNKLDIDNLTMITGTAVFKQGLTAIVQSAFPSGFNFHNRSDTIPKFETYKVGGFFQDAGNPSIWEVTEKSVKCKAVTPLTDLHDPQKYPFLFPQIQNNQGYRFELESDRIANINIPFQSNGSHYELNFGVYGNKNGWFLSISGGNRTTSLLPANSESIDFNTPGQNLYVEIGVYEGKWLIVIDQHVLGSSAFKFAAPLIHPDRFPLTYRIAPKQVGAIIKPERIGYI